MPLASIFLRPGRIFFVAFFLTAFLAVFFFLGVGIVLHFFRRFAFLPV